MVSTLSINQCPVSFFHLVEREHCESRPVKHHHWSVTCQHFFTMTASENSTQAPLGRQSIYTNIARTSDRRNSSFCS